MAYFPVSQLSISPAINFIQMNRSAFLPFHLRRGVLYYYVHDILHVTSDVTLTPVTRIPYLSCRISHTVLAGIHSTWAVRS